MTLKNINPKYNRILGLDTSSKSIAFAVIEKGELIKYGQVFFNGGSPEERLVDATSKIIALRNEFKVDLVVAESNIVVNSKENAVILGWYVGICAGILAQGAPIRRIKPLEWQSKIGNKLLNKEEKADLRKANPGHTESWYRNEGRKMRKQKTIWWVEKTYGVALESDDVADAIGLTHVSYDKWGVK